MAFKLSRRTFLLGVGTAAGAALVAACAPVTPAAQAPAAADAAAPAADMLVEIEYWHRMSGDTAVLLEQLAAEFSEQHAGEITLTSIAAGNIQELNQKIRAAAAGGGMPGVSMADDYDVTQYAASNILVPLDDYVAHPEFGLSQERIDDILPNQFNRHKLAIYDDKMMAFTQGFSAFTSYWNVDATQTIGRERIVTSWDEFPDYVRELSAANEGKPGWMISGAGDRFISCLLTYGVSWLKEGGEESNFDAPETLEIMTWWRALSDEGLLAVTQDARDLFIAGESLHFMDSSGSAAHFHTTLETFVWNAGLPPQRTPAGSAPITETYGPVNVIPATDEAKQMAGWRWISWLLTPEVHSRYIQQTSYFPSTKSAVATELLQQTYTDNPIRAALIDEVSVHAQILAPSAALPEVRGQVTANVVQEVLLGQLSPEEGVRKLKAEADNAIRNATL